MPKMNPTSTLSARKLETQPIFITERMIYKIPASIVMAATSAIASLEPTLATDKTAAPVTAAMVELGPVTTWRELAKMA
jgi:hypothetical protein